MASPAVHTRLSLRIPPNFNFWRTVYSHGWCSLLPFSVDKDLETFSTVLRLKGGTLASCVMTVLENRILIDSTSASSLTAQQRSEIRSQLSECLRIKEDFSAFHAEARRYPRYRWIARTGSGRLLRAPTVFEDVVKMMCTTNCSWSLTTTIVHNLVGELGASLQNSKAFPTPEAVAGASERFMRKTIRSGYRSPYLLEFAQRVANGRLDVESWRSSTGKTEELFNRILDIKGMGPYAAGNLIRLLGRYNHLALDSWVRAQYADLHHKGRMVSDRTIERAYKDYGEWKGLFFWLEMTRHWFDKKFPD